MKLKNKLLMPIMGVAAVAGAVVPCAVSCKTEHPADSASVEVKIDDETASKYTQIELKTGVDADDGELEATVTWTHISGNDHYADGVYVLINDKVYAQRTEENPSGFAFKQYLRNGFVISMPESMIPNNAKIVIGIVDLVECQYQEAVTLDKQHFGQSIRVGSYPTVYETWNFISNYGGEPSTKPAEGETSLVVRQNETVEFAVDLAALSSDVKDIQGDLLFAIVDDDNVSTTTPYFRRRAIGLNNITRRLGTFYMGQKEIEAVYNEDTRVVTLKAPYTDDSGNKVWAKEGVPLAPISGWYTFDDPFGPTYDELGIEFVIGQKVTTNN